MATAMLIPGNMCDARLWTPAFRGALARRGLAVADVDTTQDATIAGVAARALAATQGLLLPIGFSMGAIVALAMARIAPERIGGAALVGLNAGPDLPERSGMRIRHQAEVREGGLERVLIEELKPNYLAAAHRGDPVLLALLRDMGLALGPEVFVGQSEALRLRDDHRDVLDAFPGPALVACGAEDALCPPDWHRRWAARLPDARLAVVANAGHMLPLEEPETFSALVGGWIDERMT